MDTIQESTGEKKTREEAEADRQKLLASEGELVEENEAREGESDDEEFAAYTGDVAGMASLRKKKVKKAHYDMRTLPMPDEQMERFRKLAAHIFGNLTCGGVPDCGQRVVNSNS